MQTHKKLAKKAFKKLIQLYLENFQFYEALNVVQLGQVAGVDAEWWQRSV